MNAFKHAFWTLYEHPRTVAFGGAASGWLSVDYLKGAQFVAATLAAMVSLCALILTAPKVVQEVRRWFS